MSAANLENVLPAQPARRGGLLFLSCSSTSSLLNLSPVGRIRRGGYIFEWWIGDHPPRHIHVSDNNGKILGRIRLDPIEPVDEWQPSRKVIEIIKELQREGRL